ncbi:hypothetical protein FA15DRAFT_639570 [Coprinopsis marcescibilis]|uniref:SH3 domain-containing protein n=1 Tax=Coprinopsis marcescibilis TaxID=230819 RepID=A0A5C3KYJ2_COPMA|nr:hypothetical protein FA15DRAFT_639570 [Coprinopsis marcescibilis]
MPASEAQNPALITHIISQIEQDVHFLVSQNYISRDSAAEILQRLPTEGNAGQGQSSSSARSSLSSRLSGLMPSIGAPATPPRPVPAIPIPKQARAIWGYNENGSDPNDLSFASGDVIDVIEETNEDWWTGRCKGREGIFPANYVEKPRMVAPGAPPGAKPKPYRRLSNALRGSNKAPAPANRRVNSIGLQEKSGTEAKKAGFNKYKDTLAHSAAGGVGFGAGAAIGGGLVRAIF